MAVRAVLRHYGTSPKKVRRYLPLIRGKSVVEAMAVLKALPSPAARAILKTLQSAVANAENNNMMAAGDLRVVKAVADEGMRLKRYRPQARGRAQMVRRRTCHITIEVDEEEQGGA